jgi:hypothetical protein
VLALRGTRKKLTAAVAAAGTSLTGLFGVGPVIAAAVIAAAVIGDVCQFSRFPGRGHFAAPASRRGWLRACGGGAGSARR